MKGYMETIPLELDESAMIDGCPRLRILFQIIGPLALPGIAATAIYAFIQSWNEYMFTFVMVSTEMKKTLPVGIGQLNGFYRTEWNEMMAACFIAALPVIILFVFLQKYFIASLTAGAVKE
jgi:ABC-type glycerol-3-phosphate transport system permease component